MAEIVLTVIGADRPGLVDALAGAVASAGGSWTTSQMSRLGGQFAGIVVVSIPQGAVGDLERRLDPVRSSGLLQIVSTPLNVVPPADGNAGGDERPAVGRRLIALQLVGADHPGIVSEIAAVVAGLGIGIVELESATNSAPMSAELLFEASLLLDAPPALDVATLRVALEDLAGELMVDIEMDTIETR